MSGIVGQNLGRGSGLVKTTAVAADAVDSANIADDAIDSEHYTDGSIDNAHIADDAIDSEHYADGSIDNAHIADDAIDSEHYAAASIDNAHLADNAADTAEIADNAVTLAKMDGLARGLLIYGDSSGDPAALAVGSADQVLTHDGTDLSWEDAGGGSTSRGEVGTYGIFRNKSVVSTGGGTTAGSNIEYAKANTGGAPGWGPWDSTGSPSGTWRNMGPGSSPWDTYDSHELWVRTA